MRRNILGFILSAALLFIVVSPQSSPAKIIVGLSSVNVAFLPVYVAQEKGFSRTQDSTFSSSCSMPARPTCRL